MIRHRIQCQRSQNHQACCCRGVTRTTWCGRKGGRELGCLVTWGGVRAGRGVSPGRVWECVMGRQKGREGPRDAVTQVHVCPLRLELPSTPALLHLSLPHTPHPIPPH